MKKTDHNFCGVRILMTIIFFHWCVASVYSQKINDGSDTVNRVETFNIIFPQSGTVVREELGDNRVELQRLRHLADRIPASLTVDSIVIESWASPEGGPVRNGRLAEGRQASVRRLLLEAEIGTPGIMRAGPAGIAWKELEKYLRKDNPSYAADILAIMGDEPQPGEYDTRRKRMMDHDYGRSWNKMLSAYFPFLRRASAKVYLTERVDVRPGDNAPAQPPAPPWQITTAQDTGDITAVSDSVPHALSDSVPAPRIAHAGSNFYMSVSTNMLYDAAALPNIGVEFYLGKRFSVNAGWMYGWWDSKTKNRFWRAYGGQIGGRYWFGGMAQRKPLTGHHVGIYAQTLLYDFEWGGKGYMSGSPRHDIFNHPTWGGGVEYGFALPVSRRLNIDFSLGLGYLGGRYYEYEPLDGHYAWLRTKQRNWFGPTKLEVSLVWLIGNGNFNRKGGGE